MTQSEKEKQSYKLGHNRQKKLLVLRIYQLKIYGMYTTVLWFFMSPGIEVNILFLIMHKNF